MKKRTISQKTSVIKKIKRKLSKEQKVGTLGEQKFQGKLLKRMKHQDKSFNETMYGLQRNVAHLTQAVSKAFIMMLQAMNQSSMSNGGRQITMKIIH